MYIYTHITCDIYLGNPPDMVSADILSSNVKDETGHVGYAVKWFKYLCEKRSLGDPIKVCIYMCKYTYTYMCVCVCVCVCVYT